MTEPIGTYSQKQLETSMEYLLPTFKNFTLLQLFIITSILYIAGIIAICFLQTNINKRLQIKHTDIQNSPRTPRKKTILLQCANILVVTITIFSAICFIQGLYLRKAASLHGHESIRTMSIQNIYNNIEKLPVESKLPKDLKNTLIIYYKFGCGDCESIHNTLSESLDNCENVYFIYTRSKQGKKLRKTYPVEKVPSGMYIQSNNEVVTLPLYEKTDTQPIVNKQNLETLLKLFNAAT